MTAAEIAIKEVVSGNAIPKSATEFADMIVDNAVQNVVMDAATNRLNSRAAREYAAWKAGRGTSTMATSAFKHQLGSAPAHPGTPVIKVGDQAAKTLPSETVRAMLAQGAGWKQQVGGLEAGVGLGAGMPVAERRALLDRFEAYREQMAQNVATVFGGDVVISGAADGRQVEVKFSGPDAVKKVTQAEEYLDAKSPGWRKQTDVKITEAAPIATKSPAATAAGNVLQVRMSASTRHLAAEFVPIFDQWPTLRTPQARAEAMLAVVNRQLVAAGSPPLRVKVVSEPYEGQLISQKWEIHVSADQFQGSSLSAAKFARLCEVFAHEGRHAVQFWRMARIDPARALRSRPHRQAGRGGRELGSAARRTTPPRLIEVQRDPRHDRKRLRGKRRQAQRNPLRHEDRARGHERGEEGAQGRRRQGSAAQSSRSRAGPTEAKRLGASTTTPSRGTSPSPRRSTPARSARARRRR